MKKSNKIIWVLALVLFLSMLILFIGGRFSSSIEDESLSSKEPIVLVYRCEFEGEILVVSLCNQSRIDLGINTAENYFPGCIRILGQDGEFYHSPSASHFLQTSIYKPLYTIESKDEIVWSFPVNDFFNLERGEYLEEIDSGVLEIEFVFLQVFGNELHSRELNYVRGE